MIEADHHPSLHVDFGKFLPKLASYVNYLFAAESKSGIQNEEMFAEWWVACGIRNLEDMGNMCPVRLRE